MSYQITVKDKRKFSKSMYFQTCSGGSHSLKYTDFAKNSHFFNTLQSNNYKNIFQKHSNKSLISEMVKSIYPLIFDGEILSGRVLFVYVVFSVFIFGMVISHYIKYLSELLR